MSVRALLVALLAISITAVAGQQPVGGQSLHEPYRCLYPEQRCIAHRCPSGLCRALVPDNPRPPTVRDPQYDTRLEQLLSLDEAICVALQNAEVIRVLNGQFASSTGRTIYDPAITNTQIDQARATFDPQLNVGNRWNRLESPIVAEVTDNNGNPIDARIGGAGLHNYNLGLGVSQVKPDGGIAGLGVTANRNKFQSPSALELSYDHPLLQGAGSAVNLAPIVIARIDTERSYFQLKDSIQEMVRSVVDGYWGLVLARTQLWAREQQIKQAEYAYNIFKAQLDSGRGDIGDTAQAAVSLASFRANLITAQGELLNREAAFRNVLGLPPVDDLRYVPSTPPQSARMEPDWESLLATAEQNRPDVIELKLILEADRQRRLVANNQALPQLDASAVYRWNGLQANTPFGPRTTEFGQFTDWELGVNFSVPLGLRAGRAGLRQAELLLARDQANIRQQLHQVSHVLAQSIRSLDQSYAQYEAFRKVREASRLNLDRIFALFDIGGLPTENVIYLNVLLAITDWGNAVSSEAGALTQYNSELANLERQLGTILDNHAVQFYEEHFASIGPQGRLRPNVCYPKSISPQCGPQRYDSGDRPAEGAFDLDAVGVGRDRRTQNAPQSETGAPSQGPSVEDELPGNRAEPRSDPTSELSQPPTDSELRERLEQLRKELQSNQQILAPRP